MIKFSRLFLMFLALFLVGSAFAPASASAQRYHHRRPHHRHHWHRHHGR